MTRRDAIAAALFAAVLGAALCCAVALEPVEVGAGAAVVLLLLDAIGAMLWLATRPR